MKRVFLAVVAGVVGLLACAGVSRAQCGITWDVRTSETAPANVLPEDGRFAYDTVRQRVVFRKIRELWEWDGAAWSRRALWTGSDTPDDEGIIAFDSVRGRLVLLQDSNGVTPSKTWEWDGTTWALAATFGAPAGANRMVFVPSRGVVLLVTPAAPATTWEWNGSFWLQVAATGPGSITDMCYDSARDRVVAIGTVAQSPCSGSPKPALWEWNPTSRTWSMVSTGGPVTTEVRLYFDAGRSRTVCIQATNQNVWDWDGSRWEYRGLSNHPTCITAWKSIQFDTARGKAVAFAPGGVQVWNVHEATFAAGVSIQTQPMPQTRNVGQSAGFNVGAQGSGTLAYQWRRNGQPLANGANVTGAQSPALTLAGLSTSDTGAIDCVVSNPCGSLASAPTVLVVNPACRADLDNGTGAGQPDGGITIDDLLFFLLKFEEGC